MKKMLIIFLAIIAGSECLARHKSAVGLDIKGLAETGAAEISISYDINGKWSVSGLTNIETFRKRKDSDDEYDIHESEFGTLSTATEPDEHSIISFQYWVNETYEGAFVSIGCRLSSKGDIGYQLDIGYSMHIWKGISAFISYGTSNKISTGICWTMHVK